MGLLTMTAQRKAHSIYTNKPYPYPDNDKISAFAPVHGDSKDVINTLIKHESGAALMGFEVDRVYDVDRIHAAVIREGHTNPDDICNISLQRVYDFYGIGQDG